MISDRVPPRVASWIMHDPHLRFQTQTRVLDAPPTLAPRKHTQTHTHTHNRLFVKALVFPPCTFHSLHLKRIRALWLQCPLRSAGAGAAPSTKLFSNLWFLILASSMNTQPRAGFFFFFPPLPRGGKPYFVFQKRQTLRGGVEAAWGRAARHKQITPAGSSESSGWRCALSQNFPPSDEAPRSRLTNSGAGTESRSPGKRWTAAYL